MDQHECLTYQLRPEGIKTGFNDFYKGKIYSARWITESIAQGKCLSAEAFFLCTNSEQIARKLNIGKKKKYTIIEGIKLYEFITNQKHLSPSTNQFWNRVVSQDILPERTADSMKRFWAKNQNKTLEEFLIECIH